MRELVLGFRVHLQFRKFVLLFGPKAVLLVPLVLMNSNRPGNQRNRTGIRGSRNPTWSNNLDWSLRPSDNLQHDGLECSSFPSGLGFIEQDIIYVTVPHISLLLLRLCTSLLISTHGLRGVCIFTRRQTSKQCQHGFHLSSLGIPLGDGNRDV
ncbi:hypothetical protein EDB87DRAFT_507132 [Lactarius vividus]|nr:hypothetical protein EDB87DRAFT_507132 [Lactarius vividus]